MNAAMGFANAADEITLVLFTTLAPSGVVALIVMALVLVIRGPRLDAARRVALDRCLWIPIVVTMVGLVASATHLGNPANALYVLAGVGRSPLSNEVASGVAFLGSAGVYWLTAFSVDGGRPRLRRLALVAIADLSPVFGPLTAVFALLAGAGAALAARVVARPGACAPLPRLCAAWALVALGLFAMRFAFYMTRMTVGL